MFYQTFLSLCAEKNIKPNHVTKALGLSTATATNWKDGSIPRDITLKKIADYFGVSVDYLLGKSSDRDPEPALPPSENVIKIVGRDGSYIEKRLTDEQKKMLQAMIQSLPEAPDDL